MSKENITRRLPFFFTGVLGQVGHGKTTLSAALSLVLHKEAVRRRAAEGQVEGLRDWFERVYGAAPPSAPVLLGRRNQYDFTPRRGWRERLPQHAQVELPWLGRTNSAEFSSYETERWQAGHLDLPGHWSRLRGVASRVGLLDIAILVISVLDAVQPQTREHLLAAKACGVSRFVVFLNFCDQLGDLDWLDLVELEVRELFSSVGLNGDQVTIIRGAALPAYQGDTRWESPILSLAEALETLSLGITRAPEADFLFAVERAYSIAGKGTVAVGRVLQGALRKHEPLFVHGFASRYGAAPVSTAAIGLELFHEAAPALMAGDYAGILLRGLRREQVRRGQLLHRGEALPLCAEFTCSLTLLSTEDGGRWEPLFSGHQAQFYAVGVDVSGVLTLPPTQGSIVPGARSISGVQVKLWYAVYLTPGLTFLLCDGSDGLRFLSHRGAPWDAEMGERQWGGVIGYGVVESV